MFPQLRQLVVFPDQPSSTRRPTDFHVLVEVDNGYISHLKVRQRSVPTQEEIITLATTLSVSIAAEHVPAHASDLIADSHGIPAEVIDDKLGDLGRWGVQEAVTTQLLAMQHRGEKLNAVLRDQIAAEVQTQLRERVDQFIASLDSEVLAIAATFTEPRPSRYNYLVGGDPVLSRNRRQALMVYPWLAEWAVFNDDDQAAKRRVRMAIDQARPLSRLVCDLLECSPSVLRSISEAPPRTRLQRWRRDIPGLASLLQTIKADHRPRTEEQWQRFDDAVSIIERVTGTWVTGRQNRLWLATAAAQGYAVPLPDDQDTAVLMAGIKDLCSALGSALTQRLIDDRLPRPGHWDYHDELAEWIATAIINAIGSLTFLRLAEAVRRYYTEYAHEKENRNAEDAIIRGLVWPAPLVRGLQTAERVILPLTTANELVEEGRWMSNCVGTYASQCASGRLQVWSIRTLDGQRRAVLATKFINKRGSGWNPRISELKGHANRPADGASRAATAELLCHLAAGGDEVKAYWQWFANIAHLELQERNQLVNSRRQARAVERAMSGRLRVEKLAEEVLKNMPKNEC